MSCWDLISSPVVHVTHYILYTMYVHLLQYTEYQVLYYSRHIRQIYIVRVLQYDGTSSTPWYNCTTIVAHTRSPRNRLRGRKFETAVISKIEWASDPAMPHQNSEYKQDHKDPPSTGRWFRRTCGEALVELYGKLWIVSYPSHGEKKSQEKPLHVVRTHMVFYWFRRLQERHLPPPPYFSKDWSQSLKLPCWTGKV